MKYLVCNPIKVLISNQGTLLMGIFHIYEAIDWLQQ